MKRYMIFLAICSCLMSCEVESADKPTREQYSLGAYASESTDMRVEFPLAMMETAFNIEAYENAPAEEKKKMTYIFNSLLSQGGSYRMKNFHSFYLTPDDKSLHEPGAIWKMFACNDRYYAPDGTDLILNCVGDGRWVMSSEYPNGKIEFNITRLPGEDVTLFNWEVQLSGTLTSGQGRVLKIYTPDSIIRQVRVNQWECSTIMEGTVKFSIYDKDAVTLLDEMVYAFDGKETDNKYYNLSL